MFLKVCHVFSILDMSSLLVSISDKVNYILFITKQSREHDYLAFRIQN